MKLDLLPSFGFGEFDDVGRETFSAEFDFDSGVRSQIEIPVGMRACSCCRTEKQHLLALVNHDEWDLPYFSGARADRMENDHGQIAKLRDLAVIFGNSDTTS